MGPIFFTVAPDLLSGRRDLRKGRYVAAALGCPYGSKTGHVDQVQAVEACGGSPRCGVSRNICQPPVNFLRFIFPTGVYDAVPVRTNSIAQTEDVDVGGFDPCVTVAAGRWQ